MEGILFDFVSGKNPWASACVFFAIVTEVIDSRLLSEKNIKKYYPHKVLFKFIRYCIPIFIPPLCGCIGLIYRNPETSQLQPTLYSFFYFGWAGVVALFPMAIRRVLERFIEKQTGVRVRLRLPGGSEAPKK